MALMAHVAKQYLLVLESGPGSTFDDTKAKTR